MARLRFTASMGIWITGPADRLQPESFDEFGEIIGEFALKISRRLGYEPELNGHSAYEIRERESSETI